MFYLSLVASILIGVQSALGESTMIGFLKNFPGETVGFYGSGTGFAGIFGSGMLIILKAVGLSDAAIYLLASPTLIPYIFSFWWLDGQKLKYVYIQETVFVPEEDEVLGE